MRSLQDAINFNRSMNNSFLSWTQPVYTFPCHSVTRRGLLTSGYLWPMNCHIKIDEIKAKAHDHLDMLSLNSVSVEATKEVILGALDHIDAVVGPDRMGLLAQNVLLDWRDD